MKIIDLLNKIANGEEVPKKIKTCDNDIFYYDETDDNEVARYKNKNDVLIIDEFYLNDEVEIIEEKPKPLTKQDVEAIGYACGEIQKCFTNGWKKSLENKPFKEDKKLGKLDPYDFSGDDLALVSKINEIIDYLMENKQ